MNAMNDLIGLEVNSSVAPARIVLVEDDLELCAAISAYLQKQGFDVLVESRGKRVAGRIRGLKPDVMIPDAMVPGKEGFDVCREVRASGNAFPIIILISNEEDFDQVLGLELGADVYLATPVPPRVRLARIKAIIRRAQGRQGAMPAGDSLQFGRLKIYRPDSEVKLGERRIELCPAEFDLPWLLASNAGKFMQRHEILKYLHGLRFSGADRSIDAMLYRLRRRFGCDEDASWKIKTVTPHGYMFCQAPW